MDSQIDYEAFYEAVLPLYKGTLPDWQSLPLKTLIEEGFRRDQSFERIAYVLATAHHETARFKYMEEIGRGEGRDYGESCLVIRGQREVYYGRGFVQLTWLANYARMSNLLSVEFNQSIDLVNSPHLARTPAYASPIIWEGMIRGTFTGKNLADYINDDGADYRNARRIVNGTDKAKLIAGYARKFEVALRRAT